MHGTPHTSKHMPACSGSHGQGNHLREMNAIGELEACRCVQCATQALLTQPCKRAPILHTHIHTQTHTPKYTHTRTRTHTYMHTHTHTHTQQHIHTHKHTHEHTHTRTHIHTHTHTHTHTQTHTRTHTHKHTHSHAQTHTYTHTCTHTCTHTHTHTHTHTNTHMYKHAHACAHEHVHAHRADTSLQLRISAYLLDCPGRESPVASLHRFFFRKSFAFMKEYFRSHPAFIMLAQTVTLLEQPQVSTCLLHCSEMKNPLTPTLTRHKQH